METQVLTAKLHIKEKHSGQHTGYLSLEMKSPLALFKNVLTCTCLDYASSQLTLLKSRDASTGGEKTERVQTYIESQADTPPLARKHCSLVASFSLGIVTFGCVNNARQSLAD